MGAGQCNLSVGNAQNKSVANLAILCLSNVIWQLYSKLQTMRVARAARVTHEMRARCCWC